jgi:hypothetical protein
MKTALIAVMTAAVVVVGTVSASRTARRPVTDAEVEAAIDARLHELLVKRNLERSAHAER